MSKLFEACVSKVLDNEDGYIEDPDDPGGKTKYGISQKSYPDIDIENLTIPQAKIIYDVDYWSPMNLERIKDKNLILTMFDMAVNIYHTRAIRILQRLIGTKSDGIMGPITLAVTNNELDKGRDLFSEYKLERIRFYLYRVKVRKINQKYLYGWIKRVLQTKF